MLLGPYCRICSIAVFLQVSLSYGQELFLQDTAKSGPHVLDDAKPRTEAAEPAATPAKTASPEKAWPAASPKAAPQTASPAASPKATLVSTASAAPAPAPEPAEEPKSEYEECLEKEEEKNKQEDCEKKCNEACQEEQNCSVKEGEDQTKCETKCGDEAKKNECYTSCTEEEDDDDDGGIINYMGLDKCRVGMGSFVGFFITVFMLFYWFLIMGVIADGYLVPALIRIGRGLNMSDALLGATLLALGGAANDTVVFLAQTLGVIRGEEGEDMGMVLGGVFGTGFFVNTAVAAIIMLAAPSDGVPVNSSTLVRDIGFRMFGVAMMLFFSIWNKITWKGATCMVMTYFVYVGITLSAKKAETNAPSQRHGSEASTGTRGSRHSIHAGSISGKSGAVPNDNLTGSLTQAQSEPISERVMRHLGWDPEGGVLEKISFVVALLPMPLPYNPIAYVSPIMPFRPYFILTMAINTWDDVINVIIPLCMGLFIPKALPDWDMYETENYMGIGAFVGLGLLGSIGVFLLQTRRKGQERAVALGAAGNAPDANYIMPLTFAWLTFLTSVLWMAIVADEISNGLEYLGKDILGVRPQTMGLTMLAWGNCMDNVFAMIGLAKAREFGVAITGIYAAPMFNVFCSTGGCLLLLALMSPEAKETGEASFPVLGAARILLILVLLLLSFTIFSAQSNSWRMTNGLGKILMAAYPIGLCVAFAIQYATSGAPK